MNNKLKKNHVKDTLSPKFYLDLSLIQKTQNDVDFESTETRFDIDNPSFEFQQKNHDQISSNNALNKKIGNCQNISIINQTSEYKKINDNTILNKFKLVESCIKKLGSIQNNQFELELKKNKIFDLVQYQQQEVLHKKNSEISNQKIVNKVQKNVVQQNFNFEKQIPLINELQTTPDFVVKKPPQIDKQISSFESDQSNLALEIKKEFVAMEQLIIQQNESIESKNKIIAELKQKVETLQNQLQKEECEFSRFKDQKNHEILMLQNRQLNQTTTDDQGVSDISIISNEFNQMKQEIRRLNMIFKEDEQKASDQYLKNYVEFKRNYTTNDSNFRFQSCPRMPIKNHQDLAQTVHQILKSPVVKGSDDFKNYKVTNHNLSPLRKSPLSIRDQNIQRQIQNQNIVNERLQILFRNRLLKNSHNFESSVLNSINNLNNQRQKKNSFTQPDLEPLSKFQNQDIENILFQAPIQLQ